MPPKQPPPPAKVKPRLIVDTRCLDGLGRFLTGIYSYSRSCIPLSFIIITGQLSPLFPFNNSTYCRLFLFPRFPCLSLSAVRVSVSSCLCRSCTNQIAPTEQRRTQRRRLATWTAAAEQENKRSCGYSCCTFS